MSEKISALLDGEIPEREGLEQIALMKGSDECQRTWEAYSLIGDVLQGHTDAGYAARVSRRIAAEPVVISPIYRSVRWRSSDSADQKWFAMSAAAVISAIAFVAWVSLPNMANSNQAHIARTSSGEVAKVSAASEAQTESAPAASQDVGGYILAHQQFSPSNSMQGVATYGRLVSENVSGVSR